MFFPLDYIFYRSRGMNQWNRKKIQSKGWTLIFGRVFSFGSHLEAVSLATLTTTPSILASKKQNCSFGNFPQLSRTLFLLYFVISVGFNSLKYFENLFFVVILSTKCYNYFDPLKIVVVGKLLLQKWAYSIFCLIHPKPILFLLRSAKSNFFLPSDVIF